MTDTKLCGIATRTCSNTGEILRSCTCLLTDNLKIGDTFTQEWDAGLAGKKKQVYQVVKCKFPHCI